MRKTKIIATLGPATNSREKIDQLIHAGLDVARINLSHHASPSHLRKTVQLIREQSSKFEKSIAILFDLGGPKIRVGKINKAEAIQINDGDEYSLGGDSSDIPINMELSFSGHTRGGEIKIDDGSISFDIVAVQDNHLQIRAKNSGEITSGKGINFPGVKLNLPSVTEKDFTDIQLAIDLKADWIAMSFVRSADDLNLIRNELEKRNVKIPVIAKIEKPEAIENLNDIINAFDGILVARGDLGVEMPLKELPILQKKIVNQCLQNRKPVIIATQMLDTMIHNPTPTRAEVNDIANAIYDGADAVMLSGETAVGEYPVESVQIMADIAQSVEKDLDRQNFNRYILNESMHYLDSRGSICHAAMTISNDLFINTIVIMTESGVTAMKMAQHRPRARIFALSPDSNVCHQLALIWGITPLLVNSVTSTDKMIIDSSELLKERKFIKKGDSFIITAGVPVGVTGSTNMLKIHSV